MQQLVSKTMMKLDSFLSYLAFNFFFEKRVLTDKYKTNFTILENNLKNDFFAKHDISTVLLVRKLASKLFCPANYLTL